jgi:methionine synthase II (cobalamin-independent)
MEEAGRIYEEVGEKFRMKVCITGPYTLSYPFGDSTGYACSTIGGLLKAVVKSNIFDEKRGKVELVVFDEPLLGLINDSRLDNGSPWRDGILKSLEDLLQVAKAKGAETGLHLHSTSVDVMGLNNLDVIESHFDDPFYQTENTKRLLEKHEKWTKLPITYTQYDKLISTDNPELVAAVWKKIKKKEIDPAMYLEPWETMSLRLEKLGKMFGERGKYAGGECGLLSFPTYDCAMESLRRQSLAIADYNSKALG